MQLVQPGTPPAVMRNWNETPEQSAPRISYHHDDLDDGKIRAHAATASLPAIVVGGLMFFGTPLVLLACERGLGLPWGVVPIGWLAQFCITGYIVWRKWDTETQHWLARQDERYVAMTELIQHRTPVRTQTDGEEGARTILVNRVAPTFTPTQRKWARLCFWAFRALEDASLIRSDDDTRFYTIKQTGERVGYKEQREDYAELAQIGILKKTGKKWTLADPAWNTHDAVEAALEAALANTTRTA